MKVNKDYNNFLKLSVSILLMALPNSWPGFNPVISIASGPDTLKLNFSNASNNCDGIPSSEPNFLIWSSLTPDVF